MFDVYIGNVNIGFIFLILSIVIIIPLQLILCFKVKQIFVKLIPPILFIISGCIFSFLAYTARDWSALFYIICAVYSALTLCMCIISFIIWGAVKLIKNKKTRKEI